MLRLAPISLLTFVTLTAVGVADDAPATLESALMNEGVAALAELVEKEGDAQRGAILFHQRRLACNRCHATGDGTSPLGPDLTKLKSKVTAPHIVESILLPSKKIDESFQAVQIATDEGRIVTGIVKQETSAAIELLLPLETGRVITLSRKEIDDVRTSRVSLMPAGLANQLADRGEFLDLARYVLEIAQHGPEAARRLKPDLSLLEPLDDGPVDHAQHIASLSSLDLSEGKALYSRYCVNCHGKDGNKTLNPLARRFAKDPLKFGIDPYSMYNTISYGNGLMFPQAALLSPQQRYQVVNYIRETFIRDANPTQYFEPTTEYLAAVNSRAEADAAKFGPAKIEVAAGMVDGSRGQRMDYGPYLAHSIAFSKPSNKNAAKFEDTTERALVVRLAGDHVVCYDTERGSVSGIWNGKIAKTENSHHTSYKGNMCLAPGGAVTYRNVDDLGWRVTKPSSNTEDENAFAFRGHYLHSGQVLLEYDVAGRKVLELPGVMPSETPAFSRTLRIEAGGDDLFCLIGRAAGGKLRIEGLSATLRGKAFSLTAGVSGDDGDLEMVADAKGGLWLKIPEASAPRELTIWYALNDGGSAPELMLPEDPTTPDFETLTAGGPRHWSQTARTQGVLGETVEGYAADRITVPYANPWGSWMRTTALDFFSDGTAAVATLSGDVWIVRWSDEELSDISWSRYATGLYEPLGLKIVDDAIYVRGRDRITRLHDLNSNGEADYYECFHQNGVIGANYHAFLFDLQTDRARNFYFARSGRKSPHEGGVVRVSPDGLSSEVVCRDFRHPNGMGAGGPFDWITVSDNPSGKAVYNGVAIVRAGETYGYAAPRTTPMLAVLPATVDSSSGGQCWADSERWGPLSGQMIHTSYSRLSMFYVLTQNVSPHPNGFAIRMPMQFDSGVMRARVNPGDGQVYLVGQKGWDTQARYDGCLYRIRWTGEPSHLITDAKATRKGIELRFSCEIDSKSIKKSAVEAVRDSGKNTSPIRVDDVSKIDSRALLILLPEIEKEVVAERTRTDKKSGKTTVDVLDPIRLTVRVAAADGTQIEETVYATINSLPK